MTFNCVTDEFSVALSGFKNMARVKMTAIKSKKPSEPRKKLAAKNARKSAPKDYFARQQLTEIERRRSERKFIAVPISKVTRVKIAPKVTPVYYIHYCIDHECPLEADENKYVNILY